jgi:hypothetical protein
VFATGGKIRRPKKVHHLLAHAISLSTRRTQHQSECSGCLRSGVPMRQDVRDFSVENHPRNVVAAAGSAGMIQSHCVLNVITAHQTYLRVLRRRAPVVLMMETAQPGAGDYSRRRCRSLLHWVSIRRVLFRRVMDPVLVE